jgi:hypothetical protein
MLTKNWLDQSIEKLSCSPGFFSAFQLKHIEIGLRIRTLLLTCEDALESPPSYGLQGGVTLNWFYKKVQCGEMIEENHLALIETLLAKAEYDCANQG